MHPDKRRTHLTELRLTRSARGLVGDVQSLHRTILHATDTDARVLWALPRRDLLIVQSDAPVRPSALKGIVGKSHSAERPTRLTGPVRLSLIGHPTQAVSQPGRRGRVTPLRMDQWEEWFRRRVGHAVDLADVAVQDLGPRSGIRHGVKVTHRWVAFTAAGTVTDTDEMERLIVDGVGRGKAYGCGLLLAGAA